MTQSRLGTHRHPELPLAPRPADHGLRESLAGLFPPPRAEARTAGGARWAWVPIQVAMVAAGALLLLARVSPRPAWDFLYGEDLGIYLPGAMARPWHLLTPYAGYVTVIPRLIGQVVSMLPVRDAGVGFAVSGALVASGCGLFTYHASEGHFACRPLRAALGLSVVLLPVAPLEIADSGVDAMWYVLAALFWAALWRPRSRTGAGLSALVAFTAAASVPLAFLYAPLLAARAAVVPRRSREHAVTMGWAAGCAIQILVITTSPTSRRVRPSLANGLTYCVHDVLWPVLGWHLAWHVRAFAGFPAATLLIAGFGAAVLGYAALTQARRDTVFQVTAVATALMFAFGSGAIGYSHRTPITPALEPGARYSTVPLLLLGAALLAAADAFLRQPRPRTVAATVIVAVLVSGWVADFRYPAYRTTDGPAWQTTATAWLRHCRHQPAGSITVVSGAWFGPAPRTTFSCSRLRR